MVDQPEQLGVADVEAEILVQGTDGGQGMVVGPLDPGPVGREPPRPVGRAAHDQEAEEPLHREHAQDQFAAQFLAPADQRRRRGQAAAARPAGHEHAAAQAPPGRSARGRGHQPVPQLRFVRRVGHVPSAGTAEQVPIHLLLLMIRRQRSSLPHLTDRRRRSGTGLARCRPLPAAEQGERLGDAQVVSGGQVVRRSVMTSSS
jgi:hypothetical protein